MYQECGAWSRGGECTLWNYDAEYVKKRNLCLHFKEAVPGLLKKFTEDLGGTNKSGDTCILFPALTVICGVILDIRISILKLCRGLESNKVIFKVTET